MVNEAKTLDEIADYFDLVANHFYDKCNKKGMNRLEALTFFVKHSSFAQAAEILRKTKITDNPDPRKEFIKDYKV